MGSSFGGFKCLAGLGYTLHELKGCRDLFIIRNYYSCSQSDQVVFIGFIVQTSGVSYFIFLFPGEILRISSSQFYNF